MIRKPRHVLRRAMTDALVSLTLAVSACFATALPARAAAGQLPCAADGQGRALDFWLGHWTVSDDEQPRSATSVVSRALGECLVVESWSDAAGHRGENLFGFNLDSKTWSGMFADNRGHIHVFTQGTVAADRAQFDGRSHSAAGRMVLDRMSLARMTPTELEQTWQQSHDGGRTWTTVFRGKYSRAKP